ncbi:MAG: PqiC family protein, partial [Desulfohalobiaceae bacterium]|nr:PqiC family protein [Desulfohalobiaceae bacterium]
RSLVSLGPVQIPSYLDRPQMITRTAPNRLHLQSFHHWAEPIQETITRVLVQNLAGRLQAAKVVAFPDRFHQSPDFRILVEILRFEPIQSHGRVILKAQWSVREANGGHILCDRTSLFTHTLPDDSPEAIAAAMSQALSDLSTALAQCVQAVRQ